MRRIFPATLVATLLLCLSACTEHTCNLSGVWEGAAGQSLLVFRFQPDGWASVSVTAHGTMSTSYGQWMQVDHRICLTNARGQVRWFPISACSADKLTLRVSPGAAGLCQLIRTGDG